MHTTVISDGTPDDTDDVRIHHNGDWSGDAQLCWYSRRGNGRLNVPGWVAKRIVSLIEPDHPDIEAPAKRETTK